MAARASWPDFGSGSPGVGADASTMSYAIPVAVPAGALSLRAVAYPPPSGVTRTLFLAAIEATEEAIYNSLFRATTTTGNGHTVEALPIDKTVEILRKYKVIQ